MCFITVITLKTATLSGMFVKLPSPRRNSNIVRHVIYQLRCIPPAIPFGGNRFLDRFCSAPRRFRPMYETAGVQAPPDSVRSKKLRGLARTRAHRDSVHVGTGRSFRPMYETAGVKHPSPGGGGPPPVRAQPNPRLLRGVRVTGMLRWSLLSKERVIWGGRVTYWKFV